MEKPECFGHVQLGEGSPCYDCDLYPDCCIRTTKGNKVLGTLPWPRMKMEDEDCPKQGIPSLRVGKVVEEEYAHLRNLLQENALHEVKSQRLWKKGINPFVRVVECNQSGILVEFPLLFPETVMRRFRRAWISVRRSPRNAALVYAPNLETLQPLLTQILTEVYKQGHAL